MDNLTVEDDILLNFLWASCCSSKKSQLCEPFPDEFKKNDVRSYSLLKQVISNSQDNTEPFSSLLLFLRKLSPTISAISVKDFINDWHWEGNSNLPLPNFVFKVNHSSETNISKRLRHRMSPSFSFEEFSRLKNGCKSHFVFHGSSLESWHSILHSGFDCSFARIDGLFGNGLYFSSSLDVACEFSKAHFCCPISRFPSLRIVGAVELIDDPLSQEVGRDSCSTNASYFLVNDNRMMCLRFLLVYSSHKDAATPLKLSPMSNAKFGKKPTPYSIPPPPSSSSNIFTVFLSFLRRHAFLFILLLYLVWILFHSLSKPSSRKYIV
eukprot:GCRY01003021.1.p1 GENE.GCRY01003021.1~~GCRY01003021.1.p1  ORF type:complete len:323 (-),score=34.27 GCRY01003021.1:61-1029(-)